MTTTDTTHTTQPTAAPNPNAVQRARLVRGLPVAVGLLLTAAVWAAGAVWSFSEQRDFAAARGFDAPALLPLTIDGLALALAVVAWSAALDGRAAVQARLGALTALAASALSNATYAYTRTRADLVAVALAAGVPLAAAVAFETLLAELRKGVHRRRGLPAPAAVAGPRIIRLALAPTRAWAEWRRHVLTVTAPPSAETPKAAPVEGVQPVRPSAHADITALPQRRPQRRGPGRPAGRSANAAAVVQLAARYPDWTHQQLAAKAGCSTRTVRRHLAAVPGSALPPETSDQSARS